MMKILSSIIDWILKRKTLRTTLYILILFLVRELAAISKGESIVRIVNKNRSRFEDDSYVQNIFDLIEIFFADGSIPIVFVTVAVILLIIYIIWLNPDSKSPKRINQYLSLTVLICFSAILFWSLFNLKNFIENDKGNEDKESKIAIVEELLENEIYKIKTNSGSHENFQGSYENYVRVSNSKLDKFLKAARIEIDNDVNHTSLIFVMAEAGYGKSYFLKDMIKQEFPDLQYITIGARKKLIENNQLKGSVADELGFEPSITEDLVVVDDNGDRTVLGQLFDYNPDLLEILKYYNASDSDIIIIDDIDEISERTIQKYIDDISLIFKGDLLPELNFVFLLTRPEALSPILSKIEYKRTAFETDNVFGENYILEKINLNNPSNLKLRIDNWSDWYGSEKAGSISKMDRERLFNNINILLKKHPFLITQLGVSKNSDHLFRNMLDNSDYLINAEKSELMKLFYNSSLERNSDSHHRPMNNSNDMGLYQKIIESIAYKYANENLVKNNGYFQVSATDHVSVVYNKREYKNINVREVLYRSGIINMKPANHTGQVFKFEPIWLHSHLLTEYFKNNN